MSPSNHYILLLEDDLDILWEGYPLPEYFLQSESSNASQFRFWPSEIQSQFPMKGINLYDVPTKNVSEINLLRACIVYMIQISDSTDTVFEVDEWKFINLEGSYFIWTNKTAKVFSRLMLPGKYELYDQAFYLFGSSGKIIQ